MSQVRRGREQRRFLPRLFFTTKAAVLTVALLLSAGQAEHSQAAQRAEFKLLKTVELPTVGLKIQVMPKAMQFPVPAPNVYNYEFKQGDKTWKSEMYSPRELWKQRQQSGCWVDDQSNMLVIASITEQMPGGFEREHVTKEEYDQRAAALANTPVQWTTEAIAEWVANFNGGRKVKLVDAGKAPFNIQDLRVFVPADDGEDFSAYVFRLNKAAAGQTRAVSTCFMALFLPNPSISRKTLAANIAHDFLPKVGSCNKVTPERSAARQAGGQPSGSTKHGNRSPEYKASRDRVADSIKNLKDWSIYETENYVILSDVKQRQRSAIKELQESVELLRSAFEQFVPGVSDVKAVSVIRIFSDSDQYQAYVGPTYAWSSGLWMASKKELVIRPFEEGNNKTQREIMLQTVFHEAFHQYIFYALDEVGAAPWFNEGYAEFFRNAKISERKLEVREDENAAAILDDGLLLTVNLPQFIQLSYEEFYAKDRKTLESNYVTAWALVYYLKKAAPLEKPPRYAAILERYLDALVETKDMNKATDAAFKGIDQVKFEADFIKFWKSRGKRNAASKSRIFKDYNPN